MKHLRIATVLLPILTIGAFGTWSWYFATAQTTLPEYSRPNRQPTFKPQLKERAATPAEREAAVGSVRAQLEAFKRNDYRRAMDFQSKQLRENFGTPKDFASSMKKMYPQFARYKSAEFDTAKIRGEGKSATLILPIKLTGADGVTVTAVYSMVREDGAFRVAGVAGGMENGCPSHSDEPTAPEGFEDVAPLIT